MPSIRRCDTSDALSSVVHHKDILAVSKQLASLQPVGLAWNEASYHWTVEKYYWYPHWMQLPALPN